MAANRFPQSNATASTLDRGVKESATCFLDLIHRKRQEHQQGKHGCEILLTVSIVVLKTMTLILERVKRFVLHPSAATTRLLILIQVLLTQVDVRHPTELFDDDAVAKVKLMMLQKIDLHVCV